jgi:hypothetical protein
MPDPLLGFTLQSFPPLVQPVRRLRPRVPSCRSTPRSPSPALGDPGRASAASSSFAKWKGFPRRRRLQGFAPHESPPLRDGGLGHPERVALLGFMPSKGLPLTGTAGPSPRPPLTRFSRPGASDRTARLLRVSIPARLAGLSRDCRPSWAFPPLDRHDRSGWT